jgi:hypothetical protein
VAEGGWRVAGGRAGGIDLEEFCLSQTETAEHKRVSLIYTLGAMDARVYCNIDTQEKVQAVDPW